MQVLDGAADSHICTLPGANIAGDLTAEDVLDKDLSVVVGWGRGVEGNHISG